MSGTLETQNEDLSKNVSWLPENAGFAIAKSVCVGLGLVIIICIIWWLFCFLGENGLKGCEYVCRKTWENPPWLILSGLAASPSVLLTWYWRTRHRSKEVAAAQKQARIAQDQLQTALDQTRIANESQITERFVAAVKLLSEVSGDKIAARLGGIYSLERIATDSSRDHKAITETLAAFVRESAPLIAEHPVVSKTKQKQAEGSENTESQEEHPQSIEGSEPKRPLGKSKTDVAAALTVLGRLRPSLRPSLDDSETIIDLSFTQLSMVDLGKANLRGADLEGANLQNTFLQNANLQNANLQNAFLQNADLQNAEIQNTDLRGANLQDAILRGVNLEGADLRLAHLEDADLQGVHLQSANIYRANFQGAHLEDADLRGANLQSANLRGAVSYRVNLEGANLRGANVQGADLQGAHLEGADLQSADLQGANVQGADLQDTDLQGANVQGADLQGADLRGANLRGADLRGADLRGANLRGVNLERANLERANLKDAECNDQTKFPDGLDPKAHGMVKVEEEKQGEA